jgi:hypothetical protein
MNLAKFYLLCQCNIVDKTVIELLLKDTKEPEEKLTRNLIKYIGSHTILLGNIRLIGMNKCHTY